MLRAGAVDDLERAFVHQRPHDSTVEVEKVLGANIAVIFDDEQEEVSFGQIRYVIVAGHAGTGDIAWRERERERKRGRERERYREDGRKTKKKKKNSIPMRNGKEK